MNAVEEYLFEYHHLQGLIDAREQELKEALAEYRVYYDDAVKNGKLNIAPAKVHGKNANPVYDAVANALTYHSSKVNSIKQELTRLAKKQQEIKHVLVKANLNALEMRYVEARYFRQTPAWKTAKAIDYSESQTRRIRISALAKLKQVVTRK